MEWYQKARSRVWSRSPRSLAGVPRWAILLATFFYIGFSPFASGTVASFVAAALYLLIPALQNVTLLACAAFTILVAGIRAASVIESRHPEKDPGFIVADEVAGQWTALITLTYAGDFLYVVLAFLFFRVFDIVKLYPGSYFEKRPGGVGVMMDDMVAGVYANLAAHLSCYLISLAR